jgi:hypothetical protein
MTTPSLAMRLKKLHTINTRKHSDAGKILYFIEYTLLLQLSPYLPRIYVQTFDNIP